MRREIQCQRIAKAPACFVRPSPSHVVRLPTRSPTYLRLLSESSLLPLFSSTRSLSSSPTSLSSSFKQWQWSRGSDSVHHLSYLRAVRRHLFAFFTFSPLLSHRSLLHHCTAQRVLSLCDLFFPYAPYHRHAAMASNRPDIPLHCNICPKRPDFSDVSHLLTHIASKGHLSNYYKVKVRSSHEEASRRIIDAYDRWYAEWGVEQLMSERMNQKDKRRTRARPAGMASTPYAPSRTSDHD